MVWIYQHVVSKVACIVMELLQEARGVSPRSLKSFSVQLEELLRKAWRVSQLRELLPEA